MNQRQGRTRTMKEFCKAKGQGLHYSMDEGDVWVDCVRLRRPVIHNDYASLANKRGMPEGHAKLIRELVVPIMRGGKIVSILGVGNKQSDYTDKDVEIVTFLADVAWTVAERKQTEEALNRSEALVREGLELRVQERTADLVKINEALRRSNKALEDFAHVAAHDLQEPLRKIRTFADRILAGKQNSMNEKELDYLTRMQKSAVRMQALIRDLFNYSSVAASQEHFKVFNLKGAVEKAVKDLSFVLEESEGRIIIEELPEVEANENLMRQLFQNLISNGLKYRDNRKPVIKISSASSGNGFHEIFVEDNGIGFDEIFLDKIFKPFQRLHGKISPYEGTGMGRAICLKEDP